MSADSRRAGTQRPLGVSLLALVQILVGLWDLLLSLVLFQVAKGNAAESLVNLLGIVYLVLALSSLWLARGYAKGYEWARRRGRLLASLSIAFAILGTILLPPKLAPDSPLWTIVLNLAVLTYLGRPRVVAFFSSRTGR